MPKYILTGYIIVGNVLLKKKYTILMPAFIEDKIKTKEEVSIMYHSLHPTSKPSCSCVNILSMKLLPGIDADTCFLYVLANASHDHHS